MYTSHVTHLANRYRLELDVSDDTARTVVVLFDELSHQLVKYSAQSLLKEEDEVYSQHFT